MKNIISIPLKKQKNTDFIGKYEGKPVKFCSEIIKQLTKKAILFCVFLVLRKKVLRELF